VAASLSRDGSLVYVRGGLATQLVVLDETGKLVGTPSEVHDFTDPSLSPPAFAPDGHRVAVSIFEGGASDIWIYDLSTSILSRLTSYRGVASSPAWTPDGRRVAYVDRGSGRSVWWVDADGGRPPEKLASFAGAVRSLTFSPDGHYAVVNVGASTIASAGTANLVLLPLTGDRTPRILVQTTFNELDPTFSPDGKWLAYASNVTGRFEIYLRPFPGPGGAVQLTAGTTGATDPRWTRDGRLIYRSGDTVVVATLTKGPVPSVAQQRRLFQATTPYAASADAKRFALFSSTGNDQQVVVVLNWINELRAKLALAAKK
jgi:serine/threonine-protein kinase